MIFRCIVSDCNSKGGQSLPGHFTEGYGVRFQLVYCLGMLIMIFGLFNVITAIFVESTLKGIAAENLRVKRTHIYKAKQVKESLKKLVRRIMTISETGKAEESYNVVKSREDLTLSRGASRAFTYVTGKTTEWGESRSSWGQTDPSQLMISEGGFSILLKDEIVQSILEELDINLGTDNSGIFHGLRKEVNGHVSLPELLDTLMKLRGDASKADLVVPTVMIRSLADEVSEVQELLASHHKVLIKNLQGRQEPSSTQAPSPEAHQKAALTGDEAALHPGAVG